jgi:hypothetical protein
VIIVFDHPPRPFELIPPSPFVAERSGFVMGEFFLRDHLRSRRIGRIRHHRAKGLRAQKLPLHVDTAEQESICRSI